MAHIIHTPKMQPGKIVLFIRFVLISTGLALATIISSQSFAADLSLSIQGEIQPGVYTQLQISEPRNQVVYTHGYPQVYHAPQHQVVVVQPIWIDAPVKHQRKWHKYCHHYQACHRPVQFVTHRPVVVEYHNQRAYPAVEHRHYQANPPAQQHKHKKHRLHHD